MTVMSLNEFGKGFWFYPEDKYWNPKLKKEFMVRHSQLVNHENYGLKRTEKEQRAKAARETGIELPKEGYQP